MSSSPSFPKLFEDFPIMLSGVCGVFHLKVSSSYSLNSIHPISHRKTHLTAFGNVAKPAYDFVTEGVYIFVVCNDTTKQKLLLQKTAPQYWNLRDLSF